MNYNNKLTSFLIKYLVYSNSRIGVQEGRFFILPKNKSNNNNKSILISNKINLDYFFKKFGTLSVKNQLKLYNIFIAYTLFNTPRVGNLYLKKYLYNFNYYFNTRVFNNNNKNKNSGSKTYKFFSSKLFVKFHSLVFYFFKKLAIKHMLVSFLHLTSTKLTNRLYSNYFLAVRHRNTLVIDLISSLLIFNKLLFYIFKILGKQGYFIICNFDKELIFLEQIELPSLVLGLHHSFIIGKPFGGFLTNQKRIVKKLLRHTSKFLEILELNPLLKNDIFYCERMIFNKYLRTNYTYCKLLPNSVILLNLHSFFYYEAAILSIPIIGIINSNNIFNSVTYPLFMNNQGLLPLFLFFIFLDKIFIFGYCLKTLDYKLSVKSSVNSSVIYPYSYLHKLLFDQRKHKMLRRRNNKLGAKGRYYKKSKFYKQGILFPNFHNMNRLRITNTFLNVKNNNIIFEHLLSKKYKKYYFNLIYYNHFFFDELFINFISSFVPKYDWVPLRDRLSVKKIVSTYFADNFVTSNVKTIEIYGRFFAAKYAIFNGAFKRRLFRMFSYHSGVFSSLLFKVRNLTSFNLLNRFIRLKNTRSIKRMSFRRSHRYHKFFNGVMDWSSWSYRIGRKQLGYNFFNNFYTKIQNRKQLSRAMVFSKNINSIPLIKFTRGSLNNSLAFKYFFKKFYAFQNLNFFENFSWMNASRFYKSGRGHYFFLGSFLSRYGRRLNVFDNRPGKNRGVSPTRLAVLNNRYNKFATSFFSYGAVVGSSRLLPVFKPLPSRHVRRELELSKFFFKKRRRRNPFIYLRNFKKRFAYYDSAKLLRRNKRKTKNNLVFCLYNLHSKRQVGRRWFEPVLFKSQYKFLRKRCYNSRNIPLSKKHNLVKFLTLLNTHNSYNKKIQKIFKNSTSIIKFLNRNVPVRRKFTQNKIHVNNKKKIIKRIKKLKNQHVLREFHPRLHKLFPVGHRLSTKRRDSNGKIVSSY